jgi:uncharacterized protein (TIGR02246 family)
MRRVMLVGVCVLLFATLVVSQAADSGDAAAVQAVLEKLVHAWETNDPGAMMSLMAKDKDMVCFGTDAAERWVGWDALKASTEKQFATIKVTKTTVKDRVIKVAARGGVAWASEIWDVTARSGDETVDLSGMRATYVIEKRKGAWLIVQMHISMPVAGQAIKY